jgi:uncharacterized membrane protein YeaQ/YmgE (transglycosylase-associated protein family)
MDFIIQLILGAVGGNVGGAVVKNSSLGTAGNSIVGAVGGLILGWALNYFTGGAVPVDATTTPAPDAAASGMDIGLIIKDVIGGAAGGAILQIIAGLIKNSMAKS